MSKKRPGVDAAVALLETNIHHTDDDEDDDDDDRTRWEQVFASHQHVLGCISGMVDLDGKAQALGQELRSEAKHRINDRKNNNNKNKKPLRNLISKKELLEIVIPWKFAVGKPRNALLGQLRSNTEQQVEHATALGISLARNIPSIPQPPLSQEDLDDHVKKAIEAVSELRGVGPATASVVLSWVRPDIFCYLYDEVLDCFLPKRTYTIQSYLECRSKCHEYANRLKWTTEQVARTLWTAAKARAMGGDGGVVMGEVKVDKKNKKKKTKDPLVDGVLSPLPLPTTTATAKASKRKAQESSSGDMGRSTRGVLRKVRKM